VRPGAQLSLQLYRHHSEHWVVVNGAALVAIGDEERVVHESESVYVPVGTQHRIAPLVCGCISDAPAKFGSIVVPASCALK
jgi:mannose-6-phosphate isomerase-like protein (cupin superfamily)